MCSQTPGRMLLLVDDDAGIRNSLAELLEDEGYDVVTAVHGMDALSKLRGGMPTPCVILLDLMMPIMSGRQFYVEQQNDPALAPIPVVVISADGNIRQKALPFGGEFLDKPLKIERVLDVVSRHCP